MKWRIYYTDGSTYSDVDGPWHDAPALEVQVIAVAEPAIGRQIIAKKDRYWWDSQRQTWFGGDETGRFINDCKPGPKRNLYGVYVWNHEYQECVKRALNDPDLPVKTARHPEEDF